MVLFLKAKLCPPIKLCEAGTQVQDALMFRLYNVKYYPSYSTVYCRTSIEYLELYTIEYNITYFTVYK